MEKIKFELKVIYDIEKGACIIEEKGIMNVKEIECLYGKKVLNEYLNSDFSVVSAHVLSDWGFDIQPNTRIVLKNMTNLYHIYLKEYYSFDHINNVLKKIQKAKENLEKIIEGNFNNLPRVETISF